LATLASLDPSKTTRAASHPHICRLSLSWAHGVHGARVSTKVDTFAFGLVIIEMLTGYAVCQSPQVTQDYVEPSLPTQSMSSVLSCNESMFLIELWLIQEGGVHWDPKIKKYIKRSTLYPSCATTTTTAIPTLSQTDAAVFRSSIFIITLWVSTRRLRSRLLSSKHKQELPKPHQIPTLTRTATCTSPTLSKPYQTWSAPSVYRFVNAMIEMYIILQRRAQ
jgi:hypothetical protein